MSAIKPVTISYQALVSKDASLSSQIQQAFDSSPDSLGLLIVKDLPPSFPELRKKLLLLSNEFASLPEEIREKYTSPETSYSFGWSHG
jgi:isopenicillin N synthase-like dioxygenase